MARMFRVDPTAAGQDREFVNLCAITYITVVQVSADPEVWRVAVTGPSFSLSFDFSTRAEARAEADAWRDRVNAEGC